VVGGFQKSFHPSFNALLTIAVVVALVGSALAVALSVHHWRTALQELNTLKQERKALDVEWGQLVVRAKFMGWLCTY
jgi:cell division protein FtsL